MNYDDMVHKMIEEVETQKDITISNFPKRERQYDLIFEISDKDDKLYDAIISSCSDKVRDYINDIIPTLCTENNIPYEVEHKDEFPQIGNKVIINGQEHLVVLLDDLPLPYDRDFFAFLLSFGMYSSPIDLVFLFKDTFKSIQNIDHYSRVLSKYSQKDFNYYLFEDYIELLFGNNERQQFHDAMHDFTKEIHEAIGYQITDICSPSNLEKMRSTLNDEIFLYDYDSLKAEKQEIRDPNNNHIYNLFDSEYENIKNVYLDENNNGQNGRYKLLLTHSDFANSFLTSEWLYRRYVSPGQKYDSIEALDNTFIVSGYFKSIEQLLWDFIKIIGKGKNIRSMYTDDFIEFSDDNLSEIDTTLGSLKGFIKYYGRSDGGFNIFQQNPDVIDYLSAQISDWTNKNRNGHFHKDNIHDKEKMKEIRDDTYFLYMLILGSIQFNPEQLDKLSKSNE